MSKQQAGARRSRSQQAGRNGTRSFDGRRTQRGDRGAASTDRRQSPRGVRGTDRDPARPTDRGGRSGRTSERTGARGEDRRPAGRTGDRRGAHQPDQRRNRRPAAASQRRPVGSRPRALPMLTGPSGFTALGVSEVFAAVLQAAGIDEPYPIQQATIPDAIAGRDILGRGRTGSGKTLAFCLPLVERLSRPGPALPARRSPRALVLVPTRELAAQVMDTLRPLCDPVGLEVTLVIGGASYDKQISRLSRGTDIVVATPGRLFDLTERGAADLASVKAVVIDEADQMADLGFLPQVRVLLDQVPAKGQRLLFSATLDDGVDAIVQQYLRDPKEHATDPVGAAVATMEHRVVVVPRPGKAATAAALARRHGRTIVFVRTREAVERFSAEFTEAGMASGMLHGGMSQRARSQALEGFRRGSTKVLVATDVAARGIHVDGVSLVLQYDVPGDHKDYLHRSGRTARAGARGTVVTLVAPNQQRGMRRLLEQAGVEAEVEHRGQDPRRARS